MSDGQPVTLHVVPTVVAPCGRKYMRYRKIEIHI